MPVAEVRPWKQFAATVTRLANDHTECPRGFQDQFSSKETAPWSAGNRSGHTRWPARRCLASTHLRPFVASADSAAFRATASAPGTPAARSPHTFCAHVPRRPCVARGLEVSLRYILQDLLLQRQLRHQSLEFRVLPLQLFQSFGLVKF